MTWSGYVPLVCSRCGAQLAAGHAFCGYCGGPGVAAAPTFPPQQWPGYPMPMPMPPPPRPTTAYGAPLADWWARVGAMVLDSVLLLVPGFGIAAVISFFGNGPAEGALQFVVLIVMGGAYFTVLNGIGAGQTVGNMAASVAVRDVDSDTVIGVGRSLLRWFVRLALYVFVLPGLLSDLWPLWDDQRQTLADKVARTVVVAV